MEHFHETKPQKSKKNLKFILAQKFQSSVSLHANLCLFAVQHLELIKVLLRLFMSCYLAKNYLGKGLWSNS